MENNFTFDNFIVNDSDNFAFRTMIKISESPGEFWNPLFIYGDSKTGKTHLIHAFINNIMNKRPDLKIKNFSPQNYEKEFISSRKYKNMIDFRLKYSTTDILIIEHIEYFSRKVKIQDELFFIINNLHSNLKQIILSATSPFNLINFVKRLKNFSFGAIIYIGKPSKAKL